MGILNVTQDSFFDGGKYNSDEAILQRAESLIAEGASIIDIGACSTRPGSESVDPNTERKNLTRAVALVRKLSTDVLISADTFRSDCAMAAVEHGADIINDVSGGNMDEKMFAIAGQLKVPYVLMHMKGTPKNMQINPEYTDVVKEVTEYFQTKILKLQEFGVRDIILDPGFGFGKNDTHNYILLQQLQHFTALGFPVLVGISRKSMVNRVLEISSKDALNGTEVLNTIALLNGAGILRVHDVKPAIEAIKLVSFYKKVKTDSLS